MEFISSTFVVTATANTVDYSFTFNDNGGSNGPGTQSGKTTDGTVNLSNTAPTRTNYTFVSWCTTQTTEETCPSGSTSYSPSQAYSLKASGNTLTLYAVWKANVIYRNYTITYSSSLSSPSNMPSTQTGQAASTNNYQVTLDSKTPTLSGYTFKGWCSSSISTASCSSATYSAGGTWTVPNDGAKLTLYAIWESTVTLTDCITNNISGKYINNGNLCWMWSVYDGAFLDTYWGQALQLCDLNWRLPSRSEFQSLLDTVGTGSWLYRNGWSNGYYWSSTTNSKGTAVYSLNITSSNATIAEYSGNYAHVRCVSPS